MTVKIFTGEVPENPCEKCERRIINCNLICGLLDEYKIQQSILSQIKEIDMNELANDWHGIAKVLDMNSKFESYLLQKLGESVPCKECGGSGKRVTRILNEFEYLAEQCPRCKGTGIEPGEGK